MPPPSTQSPGFNPLQGSYCFETWSPTRWAGVVVGFNPLQGSYCFETVLPSLRRSTHRWFQSLTGQLLL
jgi:hypothetical protein